MRELSEGKECVICRNREYEMKQMGAVESHSVDKKRTSLKSEVEAGRSVPCHQAVAAERRGTLDRFS